MNTKKIYYVSGCIAVLVILVIWLNNGFSVHSDLTKLSPKQIMDLYFKACLNKDADTLRKIIYFPPQTTEEQIQERVDELTNLRDPESDVLLTVMGVKFSAKYERIINEKTAEVGVVCKGGLLSGSPLKEIPDSQVILKKENEVWKYHYNRSHFTSDELMNMIRENPNDASLYYYYGFQIMSENSAKAYRFFKKYYELAPEGFWVTEDFVNDLNEYENENIYEKNMLEKLTGLPAGNKSNIYLMLGQYFLEIKNVDKAELYFHKVEEGLKKYPVPVVEERLSKSKKELKLRKEGKYVDILDELEAKQNK